MEAIHIQGVELDVCLNCGGIWFDEGELVRIQRESPEAMKALDDRYAPEFEVVEAPQGTKRCPRCGLTRETYRYAYDTPVRLDSCQGGHGVFVEDQELAAIQEAVSDEDRSRVTGALEGRARLSGRPVPGRDEAADVSALVQALAHWRDRSTTQA
jgi:Zn-finger nucleic acid-binding protein